MTGQLVWELGQQYDFKFAVTTAALLQPTIARLKSETGLQHFHCFAILPSISFLSPRCLQGNMIPHVSLPRKIDT